MNNFVKIDTAFNYTTGIIFPCENDVCKDSSYIVITNRHLSDDLITNSDLLSKESTDYEKYFRFTIYDEDGELIPKNDIIVYTYFSSKSYDMNEDIMSFLISIKNHKLSISRKVLIEIKNDIEVLTEGYPSALSNDSISKIIRLKGLLNTHELILEGMSRYTVEDYHYYDDLTDLKVLSGLSGAPVKKIINEKEFIIGMNVSLPYQNNGENPFKLVNFMRIKYILDYLRKKGVIIYDILENSDVRIKWIATNITDEKENHVYNKTILVLGSSGAGKSSFIKSFALNSDKINSSGDGQTTRSKVYYSYSLYQPFNVDVKLLNRNEFINQRLEDLRFDLVSYIFTQYYGLEGDIYKDKLYFFKQIYNLINEKAEYNNEKLKTLKNKIIQCIMSDNNSDIKIVENYTTVLKELNNPENDICCAIFEKTSKYEPKNFLEILLFKEGLFDIGEFSFLFQCGTKFENEINDNTLKSNEMVYTNYFKNGDSTEKNNLESLIKEVVDGDFNGEKIELFYGEIYDILEMKISEYIESININNEKNNHFIFNESDIGDSNTVNILNLCLKVISENGYRASLTSMIKEVNINDSISNEFAMLFNDMKINSVRFIDTRGLDHLEKGIDKETLLKKIFNEEKEKYEDEYGIKYEDGIDAALYLKKLDSGKPTELSDVIPLIYKTSPQISLYTVLTGVDIFYSNATDQIIKLSEEKNILPKSVEYLRSNSFEILLKKHLKASERRKNILYNVLTKNIIAFYGNSDKKCSFMDSNKYNIRKLLKSIIMRENMSIEYIKQDCIDNMTNNKDIIVSLIESLFHKASVIDFGNTNAPVTNFEYLIGRKYLNDGYDFGYYGNYENRLDLCFNNAYIEVFSQGEYLVNEFSNKVSENADKIEAILINMKNKFLGKSKTLYKIWQIDEEPESTEFNLLVKKLYINAKFNPFDIKNNYYFHSFLDFLKTKNLNNIENLESLKKEYSREISKDYEAFEKVINQIKTEINDAELNAFMHKLMKVVNYTSRRKYGTLKNDLDNELKKLSDIVFEKDNDLTCTAMKDKLRKFIFKCSLYNEICDSNYQNGEVQSQNTSEKMFQYFDIMNNIFQYNSKDESIKLMKYEYLKYCFDFKSRLEENPTIKDEFVVLFLKILEWEIEKDKEECITNIINTDIDIRNSLELTLETVRNLFSFESFDDIKAEMNYKEVLKQCIELLSSES